MMPEKRIWGYASVFGMEDKYGDVVLPGAYRRAIESGRNIKLLYGHDQACVAGRWVEMREDRQGLYVEGVIDGNKAEGRKAILLAQLYGLSGLSIGYHARRFSSYRRTGRYLMEIDLWEISLVLDPMLPAARFDSHDIDLEALEWAR